MVNKLKFDAFDFSRGRQTPKIQIVITSLPQVGPSSSRERSSREKKFNPIHNLRQINT